MVSRTENGSYGWDPLTLTLSRRGRGDSSPLP